MYAAAVQELVAIAPTLSADQRDELLAMAKDAGAAMFGYFFANITAKLDEHRETLRQSMLADYELARARQREKKLSLEKAGELLQAQQQNRCSLADSVPRLQAMRLLSNDLDLAFPGLKDSTQFQQHASRLRGNLNTALAAPPGDCRALAQLVETLQADCRACHQNFR